ncbi:MAG: hypothetical protein JWQ96_2366 [Segetibacter sp.]|nr:hypothetical protein [Segetibacter sp.]
MQFQAYVIKSNNSTAIKVCFAGIAILTASIFLFAFEIEPLATYVVSIGFMIFVGGVIASGGNTSIYKITKDVLAIDEEKILVGDADFKYDEVEGLNFYFDSFYSQSSFGYYTDNIGRIEYGIDNYVSFTYKKMFFKTTFYLANENQANTYFELLKWLRQNQIDFTASTRPGQHP